MNVRTISITLGLPLLALVGCDSAPTAQRAAGIHIPPSADDHDDEECDGGEPPKLDVGPPDPENLPPTCDELEELDPSSLGCRFYAFDTEVIGNSTWRPFGISVGNPWSVPATVTIEDNRGPGLREIVTFDLSPQQSELIRVNGDRGILELEDHAIEIEGVNPAGAFRVTSTIPVTAVQINPVGGGPSAVSDASLLLPVTALDTSYIAMGYEAAANSQAGWVAMIATEDFTTVQTPEGDAVLQEFDIFYVKRNKHWQSDEPGDVTGWRVDADKPVAVFSGSTCADVPDGTAFCDHLQEQLFPLSTWGTEYVGARHPQRLPELNDEREEVVWRVIAATDDTQIALEPPVANGGVINLPGSGDFAEFSTAESFVATGDQPFMLVQYMAGCTDVVPLQGNGTACYETYAPSGDPYMLQMVPVDQWLTKMPFVTDTSYPRDFAVFTRRVGTTIDLDCLGTISDDHFELIPGTEYEVGYVNLDDRDRATPVVDPVPTGEGDCVDGQQFATSTAPVGLFVGGLDFAASYGYPAGMSLIPTWIPPEG